MNKAELGKIIKDKRLSLNLTMDYVASKADITRATLFSIEKGTSNCSLDTILSVLSVLNLDLNINNTSESLSKRERATRINTLLDKNINRFIINCVEHYASYSNQASGFVYKTMYEKGIIDELVSDYEDLHGMSFTWLNNYFDGLINGASL